MPVVFPFGPADHPTGLAATGAIALTISNQFTIIEPPILTGNATINLTIDPTMEEGSIILVKVKTTATETTTFGTGFKGAGLTGTAGKTKTKLFVFTGATFDAIGAVEQID